MVPIGNVSVMAYTLDTPPALVGAVTRVMRAYAVHAPDYPCAASGVPPAAVLSSQAQAGCPPGRMGPDCLYFCASGWTRYDQGLYADVGLDQLGSATAALFPQCQVPPGCGSACAGPMAGAMAVCTQALYALHNATAVAECNTSLSVARAACPLNRCYSWFGPGFEEVLNGSAARARTAAAKREAGWPSHVSATLTLAGYSAATWGEVESQALAEALSSKLGGIPLEAVVITHVGDPRTSARSPTASSSSSTSSSTSSETSTSTGRRLHQSKDGSFFVSADANSLSK